MLGRSSRKSVSKAGALPLWSQFNDHPVIGASFISALYVLVGLGAVLLPIALAWLNRIVVSAIGVCWTVSGIVFAVFGAANYFTHIGLIINTA